MCGSSKLLRLALCRSTQLRCFRGAFILAVMRCRMLEIVDVCEAFEPINRPSSDLKPERRYALRYLCAMMKEAIANAYGATNLAIAGGKKEGSIRIAPAQTTRLQDSGAFPPRSSRCAEQLPSIE